MMYENEKAGISSGDHVRRIEDQEIARVIYDALVEESDRGADRGSVLSPFDPKDADILIDGRFDLLVVASVVRRSLHLPS